MSQASTSYEWGVVGHSQQGASHVRQNLPNQDAVAHYLTADGSPPVILAVADGHGSAKSFRSDVGARLAVETAVEVCRSFLDSIQGTDIPAVKSAAERGIPADILRDWRRRVQEHFQEKAFLPEELDHLEVQAGAAARQRAIRPDQLPVAYGATLLVAVLTDDFLLCFQLGDGDILAAYDATGEVGRVIAKDESLIANETTSLCQDDCLRYFRCQFKPINRACPPALVLLSTDGYCNSFASPDAFIKTGTDYLDMFRTDGAAEVEKGLSGWLEDTSRNGSGDDITVGIIYRRRPALGVPGGELEEGESTAAGTSARPAGETGTVSDSPATAREASPASPEGPGERPEAAHAPGLLSMLLHPFKFFTSKQGGKPGENES